MVLAVGAALTAASVACSALLDVGDIGYGADSGSGGVLDGSLADGASDAALDGAGPDLDAQGRDVVSPDAGPSADATVLFDDFDQPGQGFVQWSRVSPIRGDASQAISKDQWSSPPAAYFGYGNTDKASLAIASLEYDIPATVHRLQISFNLWVDVLQGGGKPEVSVLRVGLDTPDTRFYLFFKPGPVAVDLVAFSYLAADGGDFATNPGSTVVIPGPAPQMKQWLSVALTIDVVPSGSACSYTLTLARGGSTLGTQTGTCPTFAATATEVAHVKIGPDVDQAAATAAIYMDDVRIAAVP
jgi:hypothetical protein